MGEDTDGYVLEPKCAELLLVLVLRIYDIDRFRPGRGASNGILATADASIDKDRSLYYDEHYAAISHCYDRQGDIPTPLH